MSDTMFESEDPWMKFAGVLLFTLRGKDEFVITEDMVNRVENMFNGERPVLLINTKDDGFHLKLIQESEAEKVLQQAEG